MKTETFKLNYKILKTTILLLTFLIGFGYITEAQLKEAPPKPVKPIKSVEKIETHKNGKQTITGSEKDVQVSIDIDFRPKVNVVLYDTETEILPARNNKIEVFLEYVVEGNNAEDIQKLHKAIEANLIQKSADQIDISMKFYKTFNHIVIGPGISKITMELKDHSKIKLTKFEITDLKIYLPTDLDLNIEAKYSQVELLFSVNGNLDINAYDGEFEGKGVSGKLDVTGKYSKIRIAAASDTKLDLYESKIWAEQVTKLNVESKYSQLYISNMTSLELNSYEDRVEIANVPDANLTAKYSEIQIDNARIIKVDMYEGSLDLREAESVAFKGKYVECDFGIIAKVDMIDGYENDIDIKQIQELSSVNGKYNEFNIDLLSKNLKIVGYEDEVQIELLGNEFEKILIDGKYMDFEVIVPKKVDYKLFGSIKYPDINCDEKDFEIVIHEEESSQLKFEYYRGKKDNAVKEIELNGYEINVSIEHQ